MAEGRHKGLEPLEEMESPYPYKPRHKKKKRCSKCHGTDWVISMQPDCFWVKCAKCPRAQWVDIGFGVINYCD